MMRLALIISIIVAFTACTNSEKVKNRDSKKYALEEVPKAVARIEFEQLTYDFGVVTIGEKVTHIFKFKNTGDLPLRITNAQVSCGCTVPEFPKELLKPGENGNIKVVFNSTNKSGIQDAVVTITSNGEPTTSLLHLTGDVRVATDK